MGRAISLIIFGVLAVILLTVGFSTISGQSGFQYAGVEVVAASDEAPIADFIVIGGKLSDAETDEWLNNYAVIPYKDSLEITTPQTRFATRLGEHPYSGEGVHDGFFLIRIPNSYKLTTKNTFFNANGDPVEMHYINNGVMAASELFIWLPEVHPGQIFCLEVPDKQTEFAIAAMPFDNAHLPDEIRQNRTALLDNGFVRPVKVNEASGAVVTLYGEALELVDREILSAKWTREFISPETLTVEAVYAQYVAPATSDMSLEQFKIHVNTFNELGSDNLFKANQKYYLPLANP